VPKYTVKVRRVDKPVDQEPEIHKVEAPSRMEAMNKIGGKAGDEFHFVKGPDDSDCLVYVGPEQPISKEKV
jgi:hypothetical protein